MLNPAKPDLSPVMSNPAIFSSPMSSNPDFPIRIYSPEPALKHPVKFFREMFQDIAASGELALALAKRDIKAMYRQSLLGYLWAFLPVLGTTGLFLFLRSGGAFTTTPGQVAYPVYILVGTTLWQLFTDGVNGPLNLVTQSKSMLVKINFPREALIIAAMLITLFNFAVRLLILIPALWFFAAQGMYTFTASSLYLFPLGVICLVLLGYTIGLVLTPMGLLYQDIKKGLMLLMNFWMFVSPVVVTIPESGVVSRIMKSNPVSPVLDTARSWLVGVEPMLFGHFTVIMSITALFLVLAWIIFRVSLPHLIARMGM